VTWEEDLDQESKRAFEKRGRDPRTWAAVADDLHQAAGVLWDQIDAANNQKKMEWLVSVGKVSMMLEGCAIEMLAKAVLVKQNPALIENGRWCGPQTGHPLPKLLETVDFTLESSIEKDLVARLAGYVAWAGRYPIPKDYDKMAAKLTPRGIELAPGTYLSTGDRDLVSRLFGRLRALTTEGQTP
jgi:hypothetical protein